MKKENASSVGTIALAALASSCCIGPAIFVVFGTSVGFLGGFSFLNPLRPYFLATAFALLGYSFWKLYLKKQDCKCEEDTHNRRVARAVLWVGFAALVFASTFDRVVLFIYA